MIDPYGSKMHNGTVTGALGRIVNKTTDLIAVGYFIKDYLSEDLEFSAPIYSDQLCFVVKKSLRIPQYLLPTICFHPLVWMSLCLVTLFSAFIWLALKIIERRSNVHQPAHFSAQQIFVNSLMVMASSPMRKFPKRVYERCLVISLSIVSLIFVSIFQSSLSTAFIKPVYYKDINTLEDLAQSRLKIIIRYPAMMDDIFPPEAKGCHKRLRDKMILMLDTSFVMESIAREGKFSTMTRKESLFPGYTRFYIAELVHLVPQCPRSYMLGLVGQKNSVYMDRVNELLLHLNNGGFYDKWIRDLNINYVWISRKAHGLLHEDRFKVITGEDLKLPFFILIGGCGIATLLFVVEKLYYKMDSRSCIDFRTFKR